MEFPSYPLDENSSESKSESKSAAQRVNAELQFGNEPNDVHTFNRRLRILPTIDEGIPADPDRQGPSKEGNVSDEMGVDERDTNGSNP